ncbi:hypothetical protein G6F66_014447 [Rhizopus arrhizus]|nr:hypothetical protein G6F66_014447 [Rhizopus arrhizus]
MDSWHSGTGAADNAAGVAVMMEAMRILKATGAKPKRTIRALRPVPGTHRPRAESAAGLAARADRCAAQDARLQQVPGLLQHGQRFGPLPWHLRAGESGGDADLRSLAGPVP